jgi:tRNA (guanine37-N1)-methyltransferase
MRFDILTIFPNFFGTPTEKSIDGQGIFGSGMLRRALMSGHVEAQVHDLRGFATDKHRTVDDRPFGGGEGMLLKPEPFAHALEKLSVAPKAERTADGNTGRETVVLLSAQGAPFTQAVALQLARCDRIVLLCGRYEGVDERVAGLLADREISVGDYVLTGGELGAAMIVDAVTRLVPGVLGNAASSAFESFGAPDAELTPLERSAQTPPPATHGTGGLLDYPQYTRPAVFAGAAVPAVLTEGNHEQVRRWRRERSLEKTLRNRPDLLEHAKLSGEDRAFLEKLRAELGPKLGPNLREV